MTTRPVIAIDLDDTLADTTEGLIRHVAREHGLTMLPGDITSADYWSQYGLTGKRAISIVHGYTVNGDPSLQAVEGAIKAVDALAPHYDFILVTSRDVAAEPSTRRWIDKHFPDKFKEVVFVGNKYVSKQVESKAGVCLAYNARFLIDDAPLYVVEAAQAGLSAILFGTYPWQGAVQHPLVMSARNWQEVERLLHESHRRGI